ANGAIICGTDESGGAGTPNLIYKTLSNTKYYTASSSASDNLAWHFNNGFVSSGASSTISDILYLKSAVNASSTLHVSENTWLGSNLLVGGTTTQPLATFALGGTTGNTADAYISGGLGVGNATTADGVLETNSDAYVGGILKVKGSATSTIDNGLQIAGSGLLVTNGAITSQDTSTSTFNGGINVTAGCYMLRGGCIGGISTTRFDPAITQVSNTTASTTIPAANFTDITTNIIEVQNDTSISAADPVNTERIYVYETGMYEIHYHADVGKGTISSWAFQAVKNAGSVLIPGSTLRGFNSSTDKSGSSLTFYATLTANDYVHIQGKSSNAAAMNNFTFSVKRVTAGSGIGGNTGTVNSLAYYSGATTLSSANFTTIDVANSRLGLGSSTPWGVLSVDQIADQGPLKPVFVVGDNGTSSPFIFVSQKGVIGFGSSSPNSQLLNVGDVVIGRNGGLTSDLYISGGLGVGNATTVDGIIESSDNIFAGGRIMSRGTATSTFVGGIYVNDLKTNLPNCNTLDTDALGAIICGTDEGGAGVPNLIYSTFGTTKYYTASSSATDQLAWHFNDGFVSSASSSIAGDLRVNGGDLYVLGTGVFNASSTAHVSGNTWLGANLLAGGTTTQPLATFALGGTTGNTADAYISGGLGVGNATTADGVLETSGVGLLGGIIKVNGTGTSTIGLVTTGGGLKLGEGGLQLSQGSCTGLNALNIDSSGGVVCGTVTQSGGTATSTFQTFDVNTLLTKSIMSTSSPLVFNTLGTTDYIGAGTTSPWGFFSIDQKAGQTPLKPIFVVGDNGTSSPFMFVSQKGVIGFGSSSPTNLFLNPGDVAIGRNGLTNDLFVSGGLGVGNATTADGVLETSSNIYTAGRIIQRASATSTFVGGISADAFTFNIPSCVGGSLALTTDGNGAVTCTVISASSATAGANITAVGARFDLDGTLYSMTDIFATTTGASVYASSTLQAPTFIGYTNIFAGGTTTQELATLSVGGTQGNTADAFISGGLGVGNATTADGILETSGIAQFGSLIKVGAGTSTFTGGVKANALQFNQPSCTGSGTLDTNAVGSIFCGADATSAFRYKLNIQDWNDPALAKVMKLRPVTFDFNPNTGNFYRYPGQRAGLIAEETQQIDQRFVMYNLAGQVDGLDANSFISLLAKAIQEEARSGELTNTEELYETQAGVEEGDIVMVSDQTFSLTEGGKSTSTVAILGKAALGGNMIGVISRNAKPIIDTATWKFAQNPKAVTLVGRARVKVSTENGSIAIGDSITSSHLAGVGARAVKDGQMVGTALEAFDENVATTTAMVSITDPETGVIETREVKTGIVVILVNIGWQHLDSQIAGLATTTEPWTVDLATGKLNTSYALNLGGNSIENVKSIMSASGNWSIDENGNMHAKKVFTDALEVGDPSKPAGTTLFDVDGGNPYCVYIQQGQLKTISGRCEDASLNSAAPPPAFIVEPLPPPAISTSTPDVPPADVIVEPTLTPEITSPPPEEVIQPIVEPPAVPVEPLP
ncbi:MAG: tail fiber domain-containing protein, partial [Patescibacteria group bacterium]